jgi:hypothetical protein
MVCLGSSVCKGKSGNNAGVMQHRADTADTSSHGVNAPLKASPFSRSALRRRIARLCQKKSVFTEECCLLCVAEHSRYILTGREREILAAEEK